MRYLILADIHSNLPALEAVLEAAEKENPRSVLLLGDYVGYGAYPSQVIQVIRSLKWNTLAIRGNHDKVVSGADGGNSFQKDALVAALWTQKNLAKEQMDFLKNLPPGPFAVGERIEMVHGAPFNEDAYVLTEEDAVFALGAAVNEICFFAHTHVPLVCELEGDLLNIRPPRDAENEFQIAAGRKYIINPGSVGQPRDQNPNASFAIFDDESGILKIIRVPYDVKKAQDAILEAGLPRIFAARLALGL